MHVLGSYIMGSSAARLCETLRDFVWSIFKSNHPSERTGVFVRWILRDFATLFGQSSNLITPLSEQESL